MIIATFQKVFPHTSLWFEELFGGDGNYNAILIGSENTLRIDYGRIDSLFETPRIAAEFSEEGIDSPDELLNRFINLDDNLADFSGVQPEISDNHPRLEFGTVEIKDFANILSNLSQRKATVLKYLDNIPTLDTAVLSTKLENLDKATKLCITADAARWRGNASDVISGYQEAARLEPNNQAIQTELAKLTRVVPAKTKPSTPDAQMQVRNLMQRQKFDQAIPILEKLVEEEPDRADHKGDLGLAYLRTGKVDLALEQLQAAVVKNPFDNGIRNNLGIAYMQKRMFDKAANEFSTILASDSKFTQALVNLGLIYARTGRTDQAIQLLEKAQQIEPNNALIKNSLDELRQK
jgi:tetratricopeptide (TPR) repeat protein